MGFLDFLFGTGEGQPPAATGPLSEDELRRQVDELKRQNLHLQAIALVREHTKMGLREAKAFVEEGGPLLIPQALSPLNFKEVELIRHGQKIEAIKAYRERTEAGLAEAKAMVDSWQDGPA